jgi:hypothetical protein
MPKRRKRSAFVPTVVFGTAVAGVVPACALGCGGDTTPGTGPIGVAQVAFDSGDATQARDAPFAVADVGFAVAAVAFCGFCDAGPDASGDAARDGSGDAPSDSPGDTSQGG